MAIKFSEHPGCHERHLQRKYLNTALFLASAPAIAQQQVEAARKQDEQEAAQFLREMQGLLQEAAKLQGQVDTEIVLGIKENLERLYQLGAGLGGDHSREMSGLRKLNEIVMRSVRHASGDDPLAMQELEREQAAYEMHVTLLEYPVVSHLLREDSPVGEEELLPTLLSEGEETIKVLMTLFDEQERDELRSAAHDLYERLEVAGAAPGFLKARVAAMEAAVQ